jgi:hypothetical protein
MDGIWKGKSPMVLAGEIVFVLLVALIALWWFTRTSAFRSRMRSKGPHEGADGAADISHRYPGQSNSNARWWGGRGA